MAVTGAAFDYIAAFGKVVGSSISSETKAILTQITGIGGIDPTVEDADAGEVSDKSETFNSLGVISRPLPPDTLNGNPVHAEVLCMRTSDGLVPVSWRDLRLEAIFPNGQKEGSTSLAGYGGGFFTLDLTPSPSGSKKASIAIGYVPYDFDSNGVAQKAHSFIMDATPGNESISMVSGAGVFFALKDDVNGQGKGIFWAVDNNTWGSMTPGKVFVQAATIQFKGNVGLGAQPEAGLPLLAGAASPPGPSVFISPV